MVTPLVTSIMRIERRSTLTPVSGYIPPGLLCVEVVDRKLNDLIAVREHTWSLPPYVHLMHSDGSDISVATTAIPSTRVSIATSSTITSASPSPSSDSATRKRKRLYPHRQEVRNSIASRLPVRSEATIHRRLPTAVSQRLLPRTVNQATFSRKAPNLRSFTSILSSTT